MPNTLSLTRRAFLGGALSMAAAPALGLRFPADAARKEQDGWIVLRLKGAPHDIGYRHGSLLAEEIDDAIRALKLIMSHGNVEWDTLREASQRLFWEKLEPEYREEIAGIAGGLKARGKKYDANDVLAYNSHIEILGYYLPKQEEKTKGHSESKAPSSCSAFVATGSATADGGIVMGHNLWWDYTMGQRFRVMLDIRPAKGERLIMDALPGFIHSGSDFAINSAGMLLTETTIGGFKGFDETGLPEFMRMRKAMQYSRSLEDLAHHLTTGNNGGYANAWLMGDVKTGEIGKLELGLKNVVFSRSRDGAYFGANFPEDPKLAEEECERSAAENRSCVGRKARWRKLLKENHGKIDAEKAKAFLADTFDETTQKPGATSATLCGRGDLDPQGDHGPGGAVNTKVVTTGLAKQMKIWARMGFSDGSELMVKPYFAQYPKHAWLEPALRDIPSRHWTLIE